MNSYYNIIVICIILAALLLPASAAAEREGWYTIHCNLDGAAIYFDGDYKGLTTSDKELTVRVYTDSRSYRTLMVEKPGYYTAEESLLPEPDSGETRHIYVTLSERPETVHSDETGSLEITSTPRGVSIYLNGIYKGTTPLTVPEIRAGTYTLEGEMDGYETCREYARVYADERTDLSFSLRSSGTLVICSVPEDAYVRIDGVLRGQTPLTVRDIESGEHRIVIDLNGYYNWKQTLNIREGSSHSISAVLRSVYPERVIRVTSRPPGAEIYLDNNYKGRTVDGEAFPVHDVSTGTHTILLTHRDYDDYSEEVEVREESVIYVDAVLLPAAAHLDTGTISVTSSPQGATVFLDNRDMALHTPVTLTDLSPGAHTVTLKLAGHGDVSASVIVLTGETVPLNILFTPAGMPAPTESSLPLLITILAVGLMILRRP